MKKLTKVNSISKAMSIVLVLILSIQLMPVATFADGSEPEATQYLVLLEDVENSNSAVEELVDEFKEGVTVEAPENLLEQDMVVAELTESEVSKLEKMQDVLCVEEDIVLNGEEQEEYANPDDSVSEPISWFQDEDINEEESLLMEEDTNEEEALLMEELEAISDSQTGYEEGAEYAIESELSEDVGVEGIFSVAKNKKQLSVEETDSSEQQWNLEAIRLPQKNSVEMPSSPIKIAILDSGVDFTEDIDITENINCLPGEGEGTLLFDDWTGHGTGMAGAIGAKDNGKGIRGINPNAEMYSIKILNRNNQTSLSSLVKGIYEAIDRDCDIINLSIGTNVDSQILHTAILDAYNAGILIVASGGNTQGGQVEYPAAYEEVLAVGATNTSGEWMDTTSGGEKLEILAPGDRILTTGVMSGTIVTSGTSIAAAQVTGAASLLWEKERSRSADFIRRLMVNTASKTNHRAGLLNIEKAFELYDEFEEVYSEDKEVYPGISREVEEAESFDDVTLVHGLWESTAHNSLAVSAGAENGLSKDAIDILRAYAQYGDDKQYNAPPSKAPSTAALHASGNYITSLIFLLKSARFLRTESNPTVALNRAYSELRNPTDVHEDLKASTLLMLKKPKSSTDANTNLKRSYCVMGFALHLVGDTFAHRTIVPSSTISSFSSAYFLSQGSHAKCSDAKLKTWAKSSAKNVDVICRRWECFKKAVGLGCIEFKDVKNFARKDIKTTGVYEDNSTFFKNRYSDTKIASDTILLTFTGKYHTNIIPSDMYPLYKDVVLERYKIFTNKALTAKALDDYGYDNAFFKKVSYDALW